jgi:hypothetical protein
MPEPSPDASGTPGDASPENKDGSPSSDEPVLRDAPADEAPGNAADGSPGNPADGAIGNSADSVVWIVDNLKALGGHPVTKVVGNPAVIDTPGGKAVQFNGADALFVGNQPIAGLPKWTAEVIFRPDAAGGAAQRWFHMQAGGADRVLFELRQVGNDWFLVSFVQSGNATARAFAVDFPHPLGAFYHVAIVVDGVSMKHFVNGVYENAGPCPGAEGCKTTEKLTAPYPLAYKPIGEGGTSLGCRYTQEAFLHGTIRLARFTPRALTPTEFLPPPAN